MAPVPMWHSTMFGPYFVAGAIFSGIAGLIIAMAALRKFLHLEDYLHPVHFQNLGKLLLMMSLLWGLLRLRRAADDLVRQRAERDRGHVRHAERLVRAALLDDGVCNFVHPVHDPLAEEAPDDLRLRHRVFGVLIGMWLERFLIVGAVARPQIPALLVGRLPSAAGRDHDHDLDVRGDDAALRPLLEVRADHLDLGDEGGEHPSPALSAAASQSTRSGRRTHERVYALYRDGDRRSAPSTRCSAGGVADATSPSQRRADRGAAIRRARQATWMWYIASAGGLSA
jgi:hypothetical protein